MTRSSFFTASKRELHKEEKFPSREEVAGVIRSRDV
jgi:hypothetical protein